MSAPGSRAGSESAGAPSDADAGAPPAGRLRQLQCELQRHLFGGDNAIVDAIVEAPPLSTKQRLDIYHNAYRVRLIEALDDTYPKLHAVLGDEVFCALGEAFIAAHPSLHRSIRWYGRELPDFLRAQAPFAAQPILAELALLEWTLAEVFDSPDAVPLERAALAAVPPAEWDGLRLELHPAIRRLDLEWNSVAVWQALGAEDAAPEPRASDHPVPWLLWRRELNNYFRSMAPDEAAALEAARQGRRFGEICETLALHLLTEETPLRAAGLIGAWADNGLLIGLSTYSGLESSPSISLRSNGIGGPP